MVFEPLPTHNRPGAEPASLVATITVTLAVPATAGGRQHVEGTVRFDGCDPVGFVGWLDLMALLEDGVSRPAQSG